MAGERSRPLQHRRTVRNTFQRRVNQSGLHRLRCATQQDASHDLSRAGAGARADVGGGNVRVGDRAAAGGGVTCASAWPSVVVRIGGCAAAACGGCAGACVRPADSAVGLQLVNVAGVRLPWCRAALHDGRGGELLRGQLPNNVDVGFELDVLQWNWCGMRQKRVLLRPGAPRDAAFCADDGGVAAAPGHDTQGAARRDAAGRVLSRLWLPRVAQRATVLPPAPKNPLRRRVRVVAPGHRGQGRHRLLSRFL